MMAARKQLAGGIVLLSGVVSLAMVSWFAQAVAASDADEYAAILALDESLLKQRGTGWHAGFTVDNAVHPDDGSARAGLDLRYLQGPHRVDVAAAASDSAIWWAGADYSWTFLSNDSTTLRTVAQLAHERDYYRTSETRFDDEENTGTLALALDRDFERLLLTVQAQTQWRRFAREGDTVLLQQPLTLDVEKDFRAHGVFLSIDWFGAAFDAALWSRISRVTDTDVTVCVDQVCLLSDAVAEDFTLYEGGYFQLWSLGDDSGFSVINELTAFAASVDHLPANYRFSVGGMHSVRGYDEGVSSGDEVAWLRNELRWAFRSAALGLDWSVPQLAYLLYDWGVARQNAVDVVIDGQPFTLLAQDSMPLRAAGLGLALRFRDDISLRLEYAVVLAALDDVAQQGDATVHARLDWRAF